MKLVRIWYKKKGRTAYISHLDITRCMARAVKRASIPAWYTQGFNPHLYMTFPLPISLGFESECECMDLKLEDDVDLEPIQNQLNQVLPEGLLVYDVTEAQLKNAEDIGFAEFLISLQKISFGNQLKQGLDELMGKPEIIVEKRTKKGTVSVDIKPMAELKDDVQYNGDSISFTLILPAGANGNINPGLFTEEIKKSANIIGAATTITKLNVYDKTKKIFK